MTEQDEAPQLGQPTDVQPGLQPGDDTGGGAEQDDGPTPTGTAARSEEEDYQGGTGGLNAGGAG